MLNDDFGMSQQAVDTALGYYDFLLDNGKTFEEAAVHVSARYGVRRDRLALLVTRRSLRQIGDSGETVIGSIATPQVA